MRHDGRKIRPDEPMYYLIPYFLTRRYDAMNMITVDVPEEPLRNYMNAKRKEGRSISHVALIIAAYLRTMAEFPSLNRFVGNKTIYEHRDITASMVVLRPGATGDAFSKIQLDPYDTVFDVQEKVTSYIESSRNAAESNRLDKAMTVLCRMKLLLSIATGIIRFLDRHGMMPRALVKASPFHASFLISNLASIRTNHIYHHVYDFGTTSVAITMGNMHEVARKGKDGIVFDRCIPLGVVMDERIASGHYFATAFSRFRQLLAKPELLELPPEKEKVHLVVD